MRSNGFLQNLFTPGRSQGITDTPTDNLAAVYVYNCRHVHKSMAHGDVSDIGTQNLVGMRDFQVLQ